MKIDLIAGARPNFMKVAPIIHAVNKSRITSCHLEYRLIHTGQHYDENMSGRFFEELNIPEPHINLGAGGGTQAEQTASIMIGYEKILSKGDKPDICMVVGDVTSTMACSIVAQKMGVKVAHIEAGIRSGDWAMPEEINRLVTDSITNYFFTTSKIANDNLYKSGITDDRIFFVGNTMIDTLFANMSRLKAPDIWFQAKLKAGEYLVITLHRPANVDQEIKLKELLIEIILNSRGLPVIFPVHPRTARVLNGLNIKSPGLFLIEPLGYLEFNYLVKNAKAVITDSGGITEETTVMGVPCITLRDNTERPETVTTGTNELIGTNPEAIAPILQKLFENKWKKGGIPQLWDGQTAERIVNILYKLVS